MWQNHVLKTCTDFGNQNENTISQLIVTICFQIRCMFFALTILEPLSSRLHNGAALGILQRRVNRNRSDYHGGREMVSVCARTHESWPLYEFVFGARVRMSFLSRVRHARIACLSVPPTWQNLPPNTRASQVFFVRHANAPTVLRGLCSERCSSARSRLLPELRQHRACSQACACAHDQ